MVHATSSHRRLTHVLRVLGMLGAAALLSCVSDKSGGEGSGACAKNDDCNGGYICNAGVCVKVCVTDTDCPSKVERCGSLGMCEPADNPACTADGECVAPTDCELASNATCSGGQCNYLPEPAATACDDQNPCTTNDACDGRGHCAGTVLPGCTLPDGLTCAADGDCTHDYCSCADPACSRRVCSAVPCHCQYSANGDATCDGPLASATADALGGCTGASACYAGVCLLSDGEACTDDALCGHGACECTDASCAARVCALSSCTCSFGALGACTSPLTDGVKDPGDCAGTSSCFAGQCKLDDGQPCTNGGECGHAKCECADAACTDHVCSAADCFCQYNTNGDGSCDGPLTVHTSCPACQKCGSGTTQGTCVFQTASEDLKDECSPSPDCGSGNCNGGGTCSFATTGTACSTGSACNAGQCSAAGVCTPSGTEPDGTSCGASQECCAGACVDLSGPCYCSAATGNAADCTYTCPTNRYCSTPATHSCQNCFAAGTPIAMADGREHAIEDVHAGDRVLGFDLQTQRVVQARVTRVFVHEHTRDTLILNGRLQVTAEHPFYADGTWKPAGELGPGAVLLELKGDTATRPAAVESVVARGGALTTYNLEVEGVHDYFAGGFLVHNKPPVCSVPP